MRSDPLNALFKRMARTGVASPTEVVGCTPAQIKRLEARYGVTLPSTYRRFLSTMGRNSGRLFKGDWLEVHYRNVLKLTAQIPGIVRAWAEDSPEWDSFALPDKALVILYRDMSDDFHFIRCDRADDSGVWHFSPDVPRPYQFRRSVVSWLRGWCKDAEQAIAGGYL
jgi:hypothetical protein